MKQLLSGLFVLALGALLPAQAALPEGETAPVFTAPASQDGSEFQFSLSDALADGPVVVYFYPAAYTEGCDREAHAFAENKDDFTAAGATIIGISADPISRLNDFSSDPDYCAGEFPVASDPDGRIAADYDLEIQHSDRDVQGVRGESIKHGFIPRTTFVLDADGRVQAVFSSRKDNINPEQHVSRALDMVRDMHGDTTS